MKKEKKEKPCPKHTHILGDNATKNAEKCPECGWMIWVAGGYQFRPVRFHRI